MDNYYFQDSDYEWMREAIIEAKKAEQLGEVPIGAVIVKNGEVIGRGHNLRETSFDPTAHAEMIAIREASSRRGAWRLLDCTRMSHSSCRCVRNIVQGRIQKVIYGTTDPKAGCAGTLMNLLQEPRFNHETELVSGLLKEECAALLTQFFRRLRGRSSPKEV